MLIDAPADAKVCAEEVFGPVLVIVPVDGVDEAFATVNDSRFGLQTGVFTHNMITAFRAHSELEVGGVVIGDVPSFRADQMPYGGREGVRVRPRGPEVGHGRLHLREGHGPDRPAALTRRVAGRDHTAFRRAASSASWSRKSGWAMSISAFARSRAERPRSRATPYSVTT